MAVAPPPPRSSGETTAPTAAAPSDADLRTGIDRRRPPIGPEGGGVGDGDGPPSDPPVVSDGGPAGAAAAAAERPPPPLARGEARGDEPPPPESALSPSGGGATHPPPPPSPPADGPTSVLPSDRGGGWDGVTEGGGAAAAAAGEPDAIASPPSSPPPPLGSDSDLTPAEGSRDDYDDDAAAAAPTDQAPSSVRRRRVGTAARFWTNPSAADASVESKASYLLSRGLTEDEVLEARRWAEEGGGERRRRRTGEGGGGRSAGGPRRTRRRGRGDGVRAGDGIRGGRADDALDGNRDRDDEDGDSSQDGGGDLDDGDRGDGGHGRRRRGRGRDLDRDWDWARAGRHDGPNGRRDRSRRPPPPYDPYGGNRDRRAPPPDGAAPWEEGGYPPWDGGGHPPRGGGGYPSGGDTAAAAFGASDRAAAPPPPPPPTGASDVLVPAAAGGFLGVFALAALRWLNGGDFVLFPPPSSSVDDAISADGALGGEVGDGDGTGGGASRSGGGGELGGGGGPCRSGGELTRVDEGGEEVEDGPRSDADDGYDYDGADDDIVHDDAYDYGVMGPSEPATPTRTARTAAAARKEPPSVMGADLLAAEVRNLTDAIRSHVGAQERALKAKSDEAGRAVTNSAMGLLRRSSAVGVDGADKATTDGPADAPAPPDGADAGRVLLAVQLTELKHELSAIRERLGRRRRKQDGDDDGDGAAPPGDAVAEALGGINAAADSLRRIESSLLGRLSAQRGAAPSETPSSSSDGVVEAPSAGPSPICPPDGPPAILSAGADDPGGPSFVDGADSAPVLTPPAPSSKSQPGNETKEEKEEEEGAGTDAPSPPRTSAAVGAAALSRALRRLADNDDPGTVRACAQMLYLYCMNLAANPKLQKYRRIYTNGANFRRKVGDVGGGTDVLLAVGFVDMGQYLEWDGEAVGAEIAAEEGGAGPSGEGAAVSLLRDTMAALALLKAGGRSDPPTPPPPAPSRDAPGGDSRPTPSSPPATRGGEGPLPASPPSGQPPATPGGGGDADGVPPARTPGGG